MIRSSIFMKSHVTQKISDFNWFVCICQQKSWFIFVYIMCKRCNSCINKHRIYQINSCYWYQKIIQGSENILHNNASNKNVLPFNIQSLVKQKLCNLQFGYDRIQIFRITICLSFKYIDLKYKIDCRSVVTNPLFFRFFLRSTF